MIYIDQETVERIANKYSVSPTILNAVIELINESKRANIEAMNADYERHMEQVKNTFKEMGFKYK